MALNVGQRQQNVHLCNPKKECKDVIATLWDRPCLFNDDEWLLSIFVIFNRMLVGVLVQKYIWILEPHHHSSWRAVLYHWNFYPMFHMMSSTSWCNLDPSFHEYKMLVAKYSRNGIIISYLIPIIGSMPRANWKHGLWLWKYHHAPNPHYKTLPLVLYLLKRFLMQENCNHY